MTSNDGGQKVRGDHAALLNWVFKVVLFARLAWAILLNIWVKSWGTTLTSWARDYDVIVIFLHVTESFTVVLYEGTCFCVFLHFAISMHKNLYWKGKWVWLFRSISRVAYLELEEHDNIGEGETGQRRQRRVVGIEHVQGSKRRGRRELVDQHIQLDLVPRRQFVDLLHLDLLKNTLHFPTWVLEWISFYIWGH